MAVIAPVRGGGAGVAEALWSALAQDYPGAIELVVALAPGDAATEATIGQVAAADPRVRVVANPAATTPAGLNAALAASTAPVIARLDAQARWSPGYLRRAVAVLAETGAANVGGRQLGTGGSVFEQAVAAAMASRLGSGGARHRVGGTAGPAETVYLGVFRRSALEAVGGFDAELARNQDYELNHRLRAAGELVWFDPELEVAYRPRGSLATLARQYFDYGRWKRVVLRRHPGSLQARQLAPLGALAVVAGGLAAAAAGRRRWLALPGAYAGGLAAAAAVSGRRPAVAARLPLLWATMHLCWAAGLLWPRRADRAAPRGPARS